MTECYITTWFIELFIDTTTMNPVTQVRPLNILERDLNNINTTLEQAIQITQNWPNIQLKLDIDKLKILVQESLHIFTTNNSLNSKTLAVTDFYLSNFHISHTFLKPVFSLIMLLEFCASSIITFCLLVNLVIVALSSYLPTVMLTVPCSNYFSLVNNLIIVIIFCSGHAIWLINYFI